MRNEIDEAIRNVSAFAGLDDLLTSMVGHGYVPTLNPDSFEEHDRQVDVQRVRDYLIGLTMPVYPERLPSDKLSACSVREVAAEDAKDEGFAKFNGGRHLCVEVPDGHFTIAAKTSEGKVITFAFAPYEKGGSAQCVDVMHHHDGEEYEDAKVQRIIAFSSGGTAFRSGENDKPVTLTTHLLKD